MRKPIMIFTGIAVLAVTALGGATFLNHQKLEGVTQAPAEPQAEMPAVQQKPKFSDAPQKPSTLAIEEQASNPTEPAFDTVRVEPTGETVVAGKAVPNADVKLKHNGVVVGTGKALADGTFVVLPDKPLNKGVGTLTLEANDNGKVVSSAAAVVVDVKQSAPALVAKVEPEAPTQVIQKTEAVPAKEIQLSAIDYDESGNIVFSGRALPQQTVRFYVDNTLIGEGIADANGRWSFKGNNIVAPGKHMLRADAVDRVGKVTSRVELPFLREEPEKVVAAATAPDQNVQQSETAATTSTIATDEPRKLVIQPGNSLWKLSREVYGKGRMYTIIYDANRNLLKNPNRIYPGQILTAPKAPN